MADTLAALFKEHLVNGTVPTGSKTPFKMPQTVAPSTPNPTGLVVPGNIDLGMQPRIPNENGTISSVRSASFQDEHGREVLIPTVSQGGRLLSMPEAINQYQATGKHLGMFASPDHADAYASTLHNDYAQGKIKGQPAVANNSLTSIGPRSVMDGNSLLDFYK